MSNEEGLFDPTDPLYELKVAEWYQKVTNGPRPEDDVPVRITVRQALKISAIMGAVVRGHESYISALREAAWFLDCAQAEARAQPHVHMSMTAAEAWQRVETYPWPRSGGPREQPE